MVDRLARSFAEQWESLAELAPRAALALVVLLAFVVLGLGGVAAGLLAGGGLTAVVLGFAFRQIGENLFTVASEVTSRLDVWLDGEAPPPSAV